VDGYRLSSYFYKDRQSKGGKIIAGPVWDYDLAFRNANYCKGSDTAGWAYQFNPVCSNDYWQVPFWWDKFLSDTAFKNNLRCRWKQLRQTSLGLSHLNFLIDSVASLTTEARQRHFQRWPVLGQYVWPNPEPIATSYEGEIETLKTWLAARLKWMDANIPNTGACSDYPAGVKESVIILLYPVPFSDKENIIVQSRQNQTININVSDASGRSMYEGKHQLLTGVNTVSLSSGYWAGGVYFFTFQTSSGERFVRKAVKQ
jgi:CotH kinase protein